MPREARTVQELNPAALWGSTEHLLAGMFDVLQGANWQRGGGKGTRPRPIERPGSKQNATTYGKARPLAETRDLFDRWRTGQLHATERERSHIHQRRGEVRHARN